MSTDPYAEQFLNAKPLPRPEMLAFVKDNIQYDAIRSRIQNGAISGKPHYLDEIVDMIVDSQYQQRTILIGRLETDIDEVAHRLLQLRQHEVEYVLNNLNHKKIPPADWNAHLIASLYNAVGSLYAYRFYQSKTYKR